MNDSHSPIHLLRKMSAQGAASAPARPALRRASRLMPLEQRFMFDAAAVVTAADAAHAKPDAAALALIAEVAAPTQVKEADPSHSSGRKEVVFVDTNVKGYKTLEAGLPEGFAVVEIDGSRDGLAQMAKWAETHTGYDAIHILSHAAEGKLELGSTLLSDSSLSNAQVQAEWAAVGHALNAGGDLMVYGCDLANGMDGDLFIHDLAKATGADVAASTDLTGAASKDANWILEKQVGDIEATAFSVDGFNDTLGNIVTGNDPGAAYSNTNSDARADVAQSFTATKTGVLTSITVYGSTTSASTLNIYSGDGTSGTLLATQSVNAFNAAGDPDTGSQRYIGSTITLNSTISITNGNQYTFQLTNADGVSITYTTNSDYSGGTAYDAGSQIDPSIDFEFSVVQGDPPNSAPSNSVAPAISGTQTVGNALSTTTGTWSDPDSDSLTYSYQWYRADDSSGTNATAIGSATSSSYTLATSDAHKYVRVVVTANDGNSHTPTANSAWTAVNDAAPTNSVVPALSGTATVGNALSTTTGTWSDADSDSLTYSYQWYRADDSSGTNAAAIGSATSSSYTLNSSDGNHYVRVVVTANDNHGSSNQTAASSWTSVATVPSVSSVVRTGGASATVNGSASSVSYTVTFSESVTGVDASDFSLTETGTASGSIASVTGSGTTYTVTVDTLSGDGTMRLDLNGSGTGIKNGSSIDIAGGYASGAAYTLDHTAPNAPSTPDMTSGTDTGSSNSDNITSNATPTFTGTAESGSTVTLYDTDGTTVLGTGTATGGNWSITASTLSAGSHTVTAKAADAAGNTSSVSSGLAVTIDTAAPTGLGLSATTIASGSATSTSTIATLSATDSQAIAYSLAAGNGTNDADNGSFTISGSSLKVGASTLTAGTYKIYMAATDAAGNVANQAFTITIVDAPSVSSVVRTGGASATVNGSASSVSYTVTFSESVTGVDASDFTLTATGTADGTIASVSGSGSTYTVTVNTLSGDGTLRLDLKNSGTGIRNGGSIDIAGGYTSGSTYSLDHTAPSAPSTPDMTSGTDTGTSSTDNITKNTTPVFTGTAEAGSTVTLYDTDGTTVLGTTTATGGNWSITSSTLGAGAHTLTAKASDAAGNVSSASSGLSITVDTTAPTIAISSDVSSLKAGETATVTFTFSEDPGSTFTWDGSSGDVVVSGGTLSAISGSGLTRTATFTPTASTNGGTASITVASGSYTDVAGNNGGAGVTPSLTFDTLAPSTPSAPDMTSGTDTGTSNTDNLTSNTTPIFTGTAEAGSTVTLYDTDGTTVLGSATATGGNWSITSSTLGEGAHTITAKATDAAGNVSSASSGLAVTIDTTAPTETVASAALSADTGTSGADFITKTAAQTVSGTLSANLGSNETVQVSLDNGSTWNAATASVGSNTWSYNTTLAGSDTLKVRVVDAADNIGAVHSQAYVLDTTAPAVNSVSVPSNGTYYIGQNMDFTVHYAEAVTVDTAGGTPRIALTLDTGGTVYATYQSGSGTSDLVFRYTVANGVKDDTGVTVGALSANGGTLRDAAGNDATLTLNSVASTATVNVEGTQPNIIDVTSPVANGSYKAGDTVAITLTFNRAVTVDTTGGTPSLSLNGGGTASYSSGSGGTALTFTYTVGAGQNAADLDYSTTSALALNGGTIKDSGGSHPDAALTLVAPGASGSLGANKNIVIDTTPPAAPTAESVNTVSLTPVLTGTATLGAGEALTVAVGGATYNVVPSGGHWSLDLASVGATLVPGKTYSVTATVTDLAGNASKATGVLAIAAPPPPPIASSVPVAPPDSTPGSGIGALVDQPVETGAATTPFLSPALESTLRNSPIAAGMDFTSASLSFSTPRTDSLFDTSRPSQPLLTQGGNFHVVVVSSSTGGEGLVLNRGIGDQVVQLASHAEISIPPDAFAHTDPSASVQLFARQPDGRPLPNWLRFDSRNGKFIIDAPKDVRGEIAIKVVARDGKGHEVTTVFHIRIGDKGTAQPRQQSEDGGRAGLSEQIHQAARQRGHTEALDRLAQLAHAFRWPNS
jgi:hypothetical protein